MLSEYSFVMLNQLSVFQTMGQQEGFLCCSSRRCTDTNCPLSPGGRGQKGTVCGGAATQEERIHSIGSDLALSLLYVNKGVPHSAFLCCVFLGYSDTKCNGHEMCGLPIPEAGIVTTFAALCIVKSWH